MISLDALRELFDYNYWARDRQLEACAALTEEQFLRPMGSSFSSVRDTLAHLVAVEWVWLERWLGRSPTKAEAQAFAAGTFPNLAVFRERWQAVENDLRAYLGGLEEARLKQPLTYTNTKGERWAYPLGETLFHVANHQTYHRGQITTMLRQLGAAAPGIDYLVKYEADRQLRPEVVEDAAKASPA
ncbi:MAG TPA: DinB family protein [Terriglobia bacterium]|nr:DinB family protein [Terriglobia bacterium]